MESVGFKEWAIICDALGQGAQSIILRKGGIAEGRDGFSFKHREFFLFPTWFHEQPEKVRNIELNIPAQDGATVQISYAAHMDISRTITSWEIAERLLPLHVLQPNVVRERFGFDEAPGLHVALVRVFRLNPVWALANEKKYGGCRSWVTLPAPPGGLQFEPVLIDAEHARRRDEFLDIIDTQEARPLTPDLTRS